MMRKEKNVRGHTGTDYFIIHSLQTKVTMTMSVFSVLLAFVAFSFEPSDAVVTSRLQVQVSVFVLS
jgi:hypothetical protein